MFSAIRAATASIAVLVLLTPTVAHAADAVLDWNAIALDIARSKRLVPPRATRMYAMVHAAMHDAVNALTGTYEPYAVTRPGVRGASPSAAAAVAAHDVLAELFPDLARTLAGHLADSLNKLPADAARNAGIAWGRFVAKQILDLRRDDAADAVVSYTPSGEIGRWAPTPP